MALLSQTELLSRLQAGEHFLLPSNYAARSLRFAFDEQQRHRGLASSQPASWQPANIEAWPHFLAAQWSSLIVSGAEDRILLNPAQEHLLWQAVVSGAASTDAASSLTNPDSLAELAAGAFRLAADYEALGKLRSFATSTDTRTFARWAEAFQKRCDSESCLPAALLHAALSANIAALLLPPELHLAGFTRFTPAQATLLDAMLHRGTLINLHDLTATTSTPPRSLRASNPHDELRLAAATIAATVAEQPSARFAILLPDIAADRGELDAVLRNTLAPGLNDIASDLGLAPWSFSSATAVANHPLATCAIDILHLLTGALPIERISALLLSPCVGQTADDDAAARLDAYIRRSHTALRPEISLTALVAWVERAGAEATITWPSHLLLHLQRSEPDMTRALTQPRAYAAWSEFARETLRAVAWPGPRLLNATGSRTREAFDATLDLLATLDFAGRRVPFRTWLSTLTWQLERASLNTASIAAPIQVLSLAESAGVFFDHALLLRATDANWPAATRTHPLLPFALQRSLAMPGADFVHDREHASAAAGDLLTRCSHLTLTHAGEDTDGPLRPSPLLAELGVPTSSANGPLPTPAPTPLEYIADDSPLPPPPASVRGGAKVLQLQAACGFRAFAELRLLASEPDTTGLGLDAADSGTLLHRTLQTFWKTVKSRDGLRALSHDARLTLLDTAIADAIADRRLRPSDNWDSTYLDIQRKRLRTLLLSWLDQEELRGPFHVLDTEAVQDITVGPLTLSVRLDRMDSVEDSTGTGVFFVDYKTGTHAAPSQWDSDRPDDPQLPLYALLPEPGELKGLAFARIRPGKDMKWHGYQSELGMLPNPRSSPVRDLDTTVAEWRITLTDLAHDFYSGITDVRPKSMTLNCRYCGQRLLCRLDPASLLASPENEADAEVSEANV